MAMENFIPDRRAISSEKKSAPPPVHAEIYASAWRRQQQATTSATTNDPQPTSAPTQQEEAPPNPTELSSRLSRCAVEPEQSVVEDLLSPSPSHSTFANRFTPAEAPESLWPRLLFCSRRERSFLLTKESLCPPPLSCKSSKRPKNIKFYKWLPAKGPPRTSS